jgi:hypothetical protein
LDSNLRGARLLEDAFIVIPALGSFPPSGDRDYDLEFVEKE